MAGFEAAALVDRDIDEYRTGTQFGQLFAAQQSRRGRAGNEDGADGQVGFGDAFFDGFCSQVQGAQTAAELAVQRAQPLQRAVDDSDFGAEAHADQRGVAADDAAPENGHPAGRNARDAAEQYA